MPDILSIIIFGPAVLCFWACAFALTGLLCYAVWGIIRHD